jgi:hypothetical protein
VGGVCGTNGGEEEVYGLLVEKAEVKIPLRRPRRRWIDNIKMEVLEIGLGGVDWVGLAQDRYRWRAFVNAVMNLRGSRKCWETIEWLHNLWPLEWCSAPKS